MTRKFLSLTVLTAGLIGIGSCTEFPDPDPPDPAALPGELIEELEALAFQAATDDVREAVFRFEFDTNLSALGSNADIYFLAYADDEDPPPAFMARFANHAPPVVPVSEAVFEPESGVRHHDTGGRGLLFRIRAVHWLTDELAEVHGGYYEGNMSASEGAYQVARRGDRWVVSHQGPRPIA